MDTSSGAPAAAQKSRRSMKGIAAFIIIVVLLGAGAYGYSKGWFGSVSEPVAVVNGAEITEKDLDIRFNQYKPDYESQGVNLADEAAVATIKKNLVEELVNEELVYQHASNQGITASSEEVETGYGQVQARYASEAEFKSALEEVGMSEGKLKANIERELVVNKYIDQYAAEQNITASEEEITALYDQASALQEGIPPLADIRANVEQEVLRQKLAEKILGLVAELKAQATVEILM